LSRSRPIPGARDWHIAFTRQGRYFFYRLHPEVVRSWLPPSDLLKHLKEKFNAEQLKILFDPFDDGEVFLEEEEAEGDGEGEGEEEDEEGKEEEGDKVDLAESGKASNNNNASIHISRPKQADHEAELKELLLTHEPPIDPFAPWSRISATLSQNPLFTAVPSDKKRQEIFNTMCPRLVDRYRAAKSLATAAAVAWFTAQLQTAAASTTWTQFLQKVKGDPHFALLDVKECEKKFKSRER